MQNVYAIIDLDANKVVREATHYQKAAEICNELDDASPVPDGQRLKHTICRLDALHLHERKYGKLN
jgi:hypothetical protein